MYSKSIYITILLFLQATFAKHYVSWLTEEKVIPWMNVFYS